MDAGLATLTMTNGPIYLDYNATTPLLPEVVDAILPYLREHFGNPSSGHGYRARARNAVDHARERVATLLGCTAAVSRASASTATGVFGSTKREAIDGDTALVTVMHSNNETGVLQPIAELARLAHDAGALIQTDAAVARQRTGRRSRARRRPALGRRRKRGTPLVPFALGASHERGLRPGTENVASIVGLGAASEAVGQDLESAAARVLALRDLLWERVANDIPSLARNGHRELRLPNTLNLRFPRISGNALLEAAPEIAASTSTACHEGHESASAVIHGHRHRIGRGARLRTPHAGPQHPGRRRHPRRKTRS